MAKKVAAKATSGSIHRIHRNVSIAIADLRKAQVALDRAVRAIRVIKKAQS